MVALICDPMEIDQIIRRRQEMGSDRYDEVWDEVYVMSPLASNEHQRLIGRLTTILDELIGWPERGIVYPGVNVTDREDDCTQNFRCPDVVVVLKESTDRCRDIGPALLGGPDFLVEVRSPNDKSLEKLDFYASIGVRELLVVELDDKSLRLFRLAGKAMVEVQSSNEGLRSEVVGLMFKTLPDRKISVVSASDAGRSWTI